MALGDKVTGSVSSMFLDHCIARYNVAKEQDELRRDAVTMYSRKFRRAKDISVADDPIIRSTIQTLMMSHNNAHYEFDLNDNIEIYIMEYTEASAGYVDWHNDFASKPLYDQSIGQQIKLSMSLMLNDDFTGGELEFDEGPQQLGKGEYLIFPSLWRHKVNPVATGTRISVVAWNYGPNWK